MLARLTTLGWVLVSVVVLTIIAAIVILSRPAAETPRPSMGKNATEQPAVEEPSTNRIYDGYDAIDFVRLTYEQYLTAAVVEPTPPKQPPLDLNLLLRQLEAVRPRLAPNLYQNLVKRYTDAATKGGVQRDEFLCGQPNVTAITAALRLGGNETVVVSVSKQAGTLPAGSLEATVNLRNRHIVELTC